MIATYHIVGFVPKCEREHLSIEPFRGGLGVTDVVVHKVTEELNMVQ